MDAAVDLESLLRIAVVVRGEPFVVEELMRLSSRPTR
jgi:hypothetical protein